MYGKQCLAVQVERGTSPYEFFSVLLESIAEEIVDSIDDKGENVVYDALKEVSNLLRRTRTDSLGLGSVIYWPNIPWEEDDSDVPISVA